MAQIFSGQSIQPIQHISTTDVKLVKCTDIDEMTEMLTAKRSRPGGKYQRKIKRKMK